MDRRGVRPWRGARSRASAGVAAFEELIGSHGGMGGPQQYPFVLVPDGFALPDKLLLGPGTVHDWMRRWLADLGHDAYRDERAAAAV